MIGIGLAPGQSSPSQSGDVAQKKASFSRFIHLGLSVVGTRRVLMTKCPIHKNRYKQVLVCYYRAVTQVLVIKVDKNGKDTTKQ